MGYIGGLYIIKKYICVMQCLALGERGGYYKMAIDKALVSGSMAMLILKLLEEQDMYGYEMIETLRQRSDSAFELKAGTLYPLLHSLESKNMLCSYEQETAGKTRKYYGITKDGKSYLKSRRKEWEEYTSAVDKVLEGFAYGNV